LPLHFGSFPHICSAFSEMCMFVHLALFQLIRNGVHLWKLVYVNMKIPFFFQTADNQNLLCGQGAVPALAALLCSPHYKVQMPSLRCLANMCFQNQKVSAVVSTSRCTFHLLSAYINRTLVCMCVRARVRVHTCMCDGSQVVSW
jgi:hypothetical protein